VKGASLCPKVMIRHLISAWVQVVGATQIRVVGRIFFVPKSKASFKKIKDVIACVENPCDCLICFRRK
jgi:hypothetical protein